MVQLTLDSALPLARRPRRRMPTLWAIASYWEPRGPFLVVLEHPHCFACHAVTGLLGGTPKDLWQYAKSVLDKAHLVDRAFAGLDGPQNIVPLCWRCHMAMPRFGRGPDAVDWVLTGGRMYRNGLPKPDAELAPCSRNGAHYSVADEPRCREAIELLRQGGGWPEGWVPGPGDGDGWELLTNSGFLMIEQGHAATEP